MKLIALDTCLGACSAAVVERATPAADPAGRVIARRWRAMATGQAEQLFPMLREVLADAGVGAKDCHGIAVTVGPGTFTGVRLGVAAARGLALAAELPVYTATSLAVVAAAVRAEVGAVPVLAAADARNGEFHVQRFDPAGDEIDQPALIRLDAVLDRLLPQMWLAGSAAAVIADAAPGRFAGTRPGLEPDAAFLASVPLAATSPVLPLYARPPDAKPQDGKSLPRAAP